MRPVFTCQRVGLVWAGALLAWLGDLGVRFVADDFETTVYWGDGFFQTTIPYWVELLGAVEEPDPVVAVDEAGVLPSIV